MKTNLLMTLGCLVGHVFLNVPPLAFSQAENVEPQKLRDPEEEQSNGASDGQVSRVRVDRVVFDYKTHKLSSV